MIRRFLSLEWKSFARSASFQTNLALKILMALGALYFIVCFLIIGLAVYPILKEQGYNPVQTINRIMIYYLTADLIIRYFMQKMPVMNIRPLLVTPLKKSTVIHFLLGKTWFSFFNIIMIEKLSFQQKNKVTRFQKKVLFTIFQKTFSKKMKSRGKEFIC